MRTCVENLRECGQVTGASVGITLSHRTIVLKDNHSAAPRFGSRTRGDMGNCLIYRSICGQGVRRVPQVQRETQRFPIKTLSQDDAVSPSPRKIPMHKRGRTGTLSRCAWRLAVHGNHSRSIWKLWAKDASVCQNQVPDSPSSGAKGIADTVINRG